MILESKLLSLCFALGLIIITSNSSIAALPPPRSKNPITLSEVLVQEKSKTLSTESGTKTVSIIPPAIRLIGLANTTSLMAKTPEERLLVIRSLELYSRNYLSAALESETQSDLEKSESYMVLQKLIELFPKQEFTKANCDSSINSISLAIGYKEGGTNLNIDLMKNGIPKSVLILLKTLCKN